jgi:hypothetical protein
MTPRGETRTVAPVLDRQGLADQGPLGPRGPEEASRPSRATHPVGSRGATANHPVGVGPFGLFWPHDSQRGSLGDMSLSRT